MWSFLLGGGGGLETESPKQMNFPWHIVSSHVPQLCILQLFWGREDLGGFPPLHHFLLLALHWHMREKLVKAFSIIFVPLLYNMVKKWLATQHLCLLFYTRGGPTAGTVKSTPPFE